MVIQKITIYKIILTLTISVLLFACGPSEEYKRVKQALETHPKITQRGAKIGEIRFYTREQNTRDKDLRFEADLLDEKGNVIGKAIGFRVEGFGTRILRVRFNDEPEPPPQERRGRQRMHRENALPPDSPQP